MRSSAWLPSIDRRAVGLFIGLVVVLLAPWPRVGRAFGALFSAYGNLLVATRDLAVDPPPRFCVPPPGEVSAADGGQWAVVLRSGARAFPLDTRIIAYTPLAIFLALALSTPVPLRRKGIVLAGGGAFLLARLAFAVLVPVDRAFGAGASGSMLGTLAEITWTVFVSPPVMSYATPLAAWWLALALTTPHARATTPRRRAASRKR
ncbi:MAG TPA: hypothetical protein VH560_04360 [Polyangia bacterium]|nr:hypothetical protein [Polyangia bacterium]